MRLVLKGLIGGLLGVWLALVSWHVWTDHQSLHQVFGVLNGLAAQQAPTAEAK